MNVIGLTRGKFAFIDSEDLEKVKSYTWFALKSGRNFYAATRPHLLMHHLIIGKPERPFEIDHINHNGLDNRKHNLRICTHAQNILNSKRASHYKNGEINPSYKAIKKTRKLKSEYKKATRDYSLPRKGGYGESGEKGIHFLKNATKNKWMVNPTINKKRIFLGVFSTLACAKRKLNQYMKNKL